MVLIITKRFDPHADLMATAIESRGVEVARLNTDELGSACHVHVRVGCGAQDGAELVCNGGRTALGAAGAVWLRRLSAPPVPKGVDAAAQRASRRAFVMAMETIWRVLSDRPWFSPAQKAAAARLKPLQLSVARAAGLRIPPTVVTNNPAEARKFLGSGAHAVYKTLETCRLDDGRGGGSGIWTSLVRPNRRLDAIALAPCVLQRLVPRAGDVRVVAVDSELFAALITTADPAETEFDWRRTAHLPQIVPYRLPTAVAESIRRFQAALGLRFGCLDFALAPGGELFFLEVNPSGQWYFIEAACGLPILAALSDALIRAERRER